MIHQADVLKATQKYGSPNGKYGKQFTSEVDSLNQRSIQNLNRLGLSSFKSPEIGKSAGVISNWGQNIGMKPTSLYSLSKVARTLSPVALLAGGKAALASTGVGAIPVVIESAVEEAVMRSVTYTPEECISQQISNSQRLQSSAEAKLGFSFLEFDSTNCKPSAQIGPKLTQFLQLNSENKLSLLSKNDQLCSAIMRLHDSNTEKLKNFKAICVGSQGDFKLRDLKAEAGNYKVIQTRSKEARGAGLVGQDYEDYVRGNLTSLDQEVSLLKNGFQVNYTSPSKNQQSCSKMTLTSEKLGKSFRNSCLPLTQPVLDSIYDYAALSAHCSGEKVNTVSSVQIQTEAEPQPRPRKARPFKGQR